MGVFSGFSEKDDNVRSDVVVGGNVPLNRTRDEEQPNFGVAEPFLLVIKRNSAMAYASICPCMATRAAIIKKIRSTEEGKIGKCHDKKVENAWKRHDSFKRVMTKHTSTRTQFDSKNSHCMALYVDECFMPSVCCYFDDPTFLAFRRWCCG